MSLTVGSRYRRAGQLVTLVAIDQHKGQAAYVVNSKQGNVITSTRLTHTEATQQLQPVEATEARQLTLF